MLSKRLRNSCEDLRSTDNSLTLLTLLADLTDYIRIYSFRFKTVKVYLNFVNKKYYAILAVVIVAEAVRTGIGETARIIYSGYTNIRDEDSFRIPYKKLLNIRDSGKSLSLALKTTEDYKTIRIKIVRMILFKLNLIANSTYQSRR